MPKISVITPTCRPEGLDLVGRALKQQTFKDFEWLVSVPHNKMIFNSNNYRLLFEKPKKKGEVWTLNQGYNELIRYSKGELIVSWQDYTYAKPDALEKFWKHYQNDNSVIVSGVGNKYKDDSWTVQTWADPRENDKNGSYYSCYFMDIEWNFCAIPKKALYAVGGFDEWLDKYYGMDGFSVNDRLNILGSWDFRLDQTNKSYSLEHGRPEMWDEKNALGAVYNERRKAYLDNPVLPFLDKKGIITKPT